MSSQNIDSILDEESSSQLVEDMSYLNHGT